MENTTEIIGYKCFNKDMTNNYGVKFEVGKTYTVNEPIIFGLKGNGFHIAEKLEDTLRYFNADKEEISICLVKGKDKIVESSDEYYGYYNLYAVQTLEIIKKLSREEIINIALSLHEIRLIRFISTFKLTKEEIELFKEIYKNNINIISYIEYYQENKLDAFTKTLKKYKKI